MDIEKAMPAGQAAGIESKLPTAGGCLAGARGRFDKPASPAGTVVRFHHPPSKCIWLPAVISSVHLPRPTAITLPAGNDFNKHFFSAGVERASDTRLGSSGDS